MPRNRRQVIAKNISGGTSAPRSAARGPRTGLNANQPANRGKIGIAPNQPAREPGGGLNAAPQAGAPKVAAPALLPWDVAAQNQVAGAGKSLSNTLTGLDAQWGQRQQYYGLEGPWADYKTNPYSQAALLQRSYDIANRAAQTGSGYGLYSGSQVNARNYNTRDFGEGRDALQRASAEDFTKYQGARQEAQDRYREELAEAEWERINAGLSEEPEPMPGKGGGGRKKRGGSKRQEAIKQNIGIGRGRRAR